MFQNQGAHKEAPSEYDIPAPPPRRRIVIVEDVEVQREVLAEYLKRSGFDVDQAHDGASFRALCAKNRYDLAVVDLHLPDEDGLDLIRYLRATQESGIIVLTGNDDPTDRIVGLEIGADDFIVKPHPPRELLARARGVLRRIAPVAPAPVPEPVKPAQATLGDWALADDSRSLTNPDGRRIALTPFEFALMREFLGAAGEILDRDRLMRSVYNRAWEYEDRAMDVLVTRLRQKIEPTGEAHRIKSVRGKGYVLEAAGHVQDHRALTQDRRTDAKPSSDDDVCDTGPRPRF